MLAWGGPLPPLGPEILTSPRAASGLEAALDSVPELMPRRELRTPTAGSDLIPASGGWSEERVVVIGFVILAALAGLIIFVASFLDSLT